MIRHGCSPIRSRKVPHDDVTSTLAINLIAESLKSSDNLTPGDDRQLAHSIDLDDLFIDWWRHRLAPLLKTFNV